MMKRVQMINKTRRIKDYENYLNKKAEEFKLTGKDISNLTDLQLMIPYWFVDGVLKPNKLDEWFKDFFGRIGEITLKDLKDGQ
jgi:hypothetical protein